MIRKGNRMDGTPYLSINGQLKQLKRFELRSSRSIPESEIQKVIESCPNILPFSDLDKRLGEFTHLCREYPTPSGPIDNVLLGDEGEICLVETKLWQNPDARRKVVGQLIDYASRVKGTPYLEFEKKINSLRKTNESLYETYKGSFKTEELAEHEFVDAVSDTLRKGSFVLLIVGDGIRSEVEEMADFMNKGPGSLYSLGLVEIRVYETENGKLYFPMLVTKTTEIYRTVIEIKDEKINASIVSNEPKDQIKNITLEQQTEDTIVQSARVQFDERTVQNIKLVFDLAKSKGLEFIFHRKDHSIGKNLPSINGFAWLGFIEIWDHYWAGKQNMINDLQLFLYKNVSRRSEKIDEFLFDATTMQQYLEGTAKLFGKEWALEKGYGGRYHMEIKASDSGMETKLPVLFDLIEVFVDKANKQASEV